MSVTEGAAVVPVLPLSKGLALIFDLDGVVVDSMPVHTLAWKQYLESAKWSRINGEFRMHGRRNDEIIREFLGPAADPGIVFEHGAAKERLYRDMMRGQLDRRLVPGVANFLKRASGGSPVGLATNAERANVDFVLDGAGLRPYFHAIVDGGEVERAKPAPDVYLRAAAALGVDPRNCIVFEDSPVGVASAAAAGARVVGILTNLSALNDTQFATADFLDPELDRWLATQRVS